MKQKEIDSKIRNIKGEIDSLEAIEPPAPTDLEELHESLRNFDNEISKLRQEIIVQQRVVDEVRLESDELKKEDDEKRIKEKELGNIIDSLTVFFLIFILFFLFLFLFFYYFNFLI